MTLLLTVDRKSVPRHHGTPDKSVAIPPPATAALPFRAIGCSVRGDSRGNSKTSCTSKRILMNYVRVADPTARVAGCAASISSLLYFAGGSSATSALSVNEILQRYGKKMDDSQPDAAGRHRARERHRSGRSPVLLWRQQQRDSVLRHGLQQRADLQTVVAKSPSAMTGGPLIRVLCD